MCKMTIGDIPPIAAFIRSTANCDTSHFVKCVDNTKTITTIIPTAANSAVRIDILLSKTVHKHRIYWCFFYVRFMVGCAGASRDALRSVLGSDVNPVQSATLLIDIDCGSLNSSSGHCHE